MVRIIFFLLSGLDVPTLADDADIADVPSGKIMLSSHTFVCVTELKILTYMCYYY